MIAPPKPSRQELSAWLADLPLGNPDYCTDAIRLALETYNARKDIPVTTKSEMAELLRPAVLGLVQRAATYFTDVRLPYSEEARVYASRGVELHGALARAYISAALRPRPLETASQEIDPRFPDLYRGIQHHGLVLLSISQLYRTPPPEYWAIFYRLFRMAENQGLLSQRFEDSGEPGSCQMPFGIFKRILLFHLANTLHLRQMEMLLFYELLGKIADSALIGNRTDMDPQPPEYFFLLDSNRPPEIFRGDDTKIEHPLDIRFLYVRKLAKEVVTTVFGTTFAAGLNTVSRSAAKRVAKGLRGTRRRRWKRSPGSGTCELAVGLSGVIRALTPPKAETGNSSPKNTLDDWQTSDLELEEWERGWEPGLESGRREMRNETDMRELLLGKYRDIPIDIWGKKSGVRQASQTTSWIKVNIVDSGPQGYCFSRSTDTKAWAKVGDVVGMTLPNACINPGVIRWLRVEEEETFLLGVELLAPNPEVVEILELGVTSKGKALLLPSNRILQTPPEILLIPGSQPNGEILEVKIGKDIRLFRIHETMETTPSYYRYSLLEVMSRPLES